MPSLNDVLAGSQAQAVQVQQIIDALKGTPNKGVPVALVSLNDQNNYALTVQNDDPINSRALSVLKADGTTLISADATGVTLGAPINVPAGSLNGTQLANASVTNAKLASDTARANLLTNGGFEVWQRGNGPFTASGAFTADRWFMSLGGGSTLSVVKNTANVDPGFFSATCAACTYSHGALSFFFQKIEDWASFKARTVSFSIRVSTSTANAVSISLNDGVTTQTSSFHPGNGTYQTLTVTMNVSGSASALNCNVLFNASCTAYLDNAMLVVGSVPADFAPLHPADDLARCQRYYEVTGSAGEVLVTGQAGSTTSAFSAFRFRVTKAVVPTMTSTGAFNTTVSNGGAQAVTGISFGATTINDAQINITVASGLVAGNATMLMVAGGGSIVAEANP